MGIGLGAKAKLGGGFAELAVSKESLGPGGTVPPWRVTACCSVHQMMSLNPYGHQLPKQSSGKVVFILRDKYPRLSFHKIKEDPVAVKLEVLSYLDV